jgi:hypothetical protein
VHGTDPVEKETKVLVNFGSVSLVLAPAIESVKGHVEEDEGFVELLWL